MGGLHHKVNNFIILMNNNIIIDGKGPWETTEYISDIFIYFSS